MLFTKMFWKKTHIFQAQQKELGQVFQATENIFQVPGIAASEHVFQAHEQALNVSQASQRVSGYDLHNISSEQCPDNGASSAPGAFHDTSQRITKYQFPNISSQQTTPKQVNQTQVQAKITQKKPHIWRWIKISVLSVIFSLLFGHWLDTKLFQLSRGGAKFYFEDFDFTDADEIYLSIKRNKDTTEYFYTHYPIGSKADLLVYDAVTAGMSCYYRFDSEGFKKIYNEIGFAYKEIAYCNFSRFDITNFGANGTGYSLHIYVDQNGFILYIDVLSTLRGFY